MLLFPVKYIFMLIVQALGCPSEIVFKSRWLRTTALDLFVFSFLPVNFFGQNIDCS